MDGLRLFPEAEGSVDYGTRLWEQLRPIAPGDPLVLDLFAGCGGLALGFESAGFRTHGFEMDAHYAATYRLNLEGECTEEFLTPDSELPESATVIIGGPPCQPFSVRGAQKGGGDSRDGFPTFLSAVSRIRPKLALIENVRGMLYRNRPYLDDVVSELEEMGYEVDFKLLNAKDFGVPQNRERVIIVAHLGGWKWPSPDTGKLVSAGEALGEMAFEAPEESKFLTPSMDQYVAEYERKSGCARPRDLHLDRPARTLTCRNLAGSTSDMQRIRLPDGRRRRLLLREAARLQSFPDWFEFTGGEQSAFYQVGNSVAPLFALKLATSAREYLDLLPQSSELSSVPTAEELPG
ncbi:MAG: DNA cytosine methyltransferase [Solirubrobacterales bacterium]|nr:DNA cytosine methyltransferase [Solirubrobacterales bacterium]